MTIHPVPEGLPPSRTQKTVAREVREAIQPLRDALWAYVLAQGRMRDGWAEGDEERKKMLWRELHLCEEAGRAALEEAYPN